MYTQSLCIPSPYVCPVLPLNMDPSPCIPYIVADCCLYDIFLLLRPLLEPITMIHTLEKYASNGYPLTIPLCQNKDERDFERNLNFALKCSSQSDMTDLGLLLLSHGADGFEYCTHPELVTTWIGKYGQPNKDQILSCFQSSCQWGHLENAQWLTQRFGLNRNDARAEYNKALSWACEKGHLNVAQWLTQRFRLTREDARAYDNEALRWACHEGHLQVAQWLTSQFRLNGKDARARNNAALRLACLYGHLEVAQWLTSQFRLNGDDLGSPPWNDNPNSIDIKTMLKEIRKEQ